MEHNEGESKAEILRRVFPGLEDEHLAELVGAVERRIYPPDVILCCEGCVEDTFYVIVGGTVEISKRLDGEVQRVLQRPGPGEFFGEIALLHDCPRTATVRTLETTTVLEIDRGAFTSVLRRSAAMAVRIMLQVTSRLRDADRGAIADLYRNNVELTRAHAELERALREARAEASKTRAILAGIADGVIVSDRNGKVISVNDTVAHFVGRPAQEIVGCDTATLLEDVNAQSRQEILDLLASPERRPIRFEWRDRTLAASFAPVRLASGEELGVVSVLRDVTREAELERARQSLFAVAAHELRTPLNAIINFANIMWAGLLPPERMRGAARRIAANGERLLLLVNNLLERARMEVGRVSVSVSRFAPAELVAEACDLMSVLAEEKDLELSSRVFDGAPATVSSDRDRLFQVLLNLISNAIKFTEEGTVRVRAFAPDANHWALEVSDTGSGIPEEALPRIFEPFELAEDPATRKHAGAGLGLSITRQIVELLGGEIGLESEVGRGSTFTVLLPLAPPQEKGGAFSGEVK